MSQIVDYKLPIAVTIGGLSVNLNHLKRTYATMMWGMNTYKEWRYHCLSDPRWFDVRIFEADLDNVMLNIENFQLVMCKFNAEVTKLKDGTDYPGKTLYHLVISIQKFLNEKGIAWKLVESKEFSQLRNVLYNTLKERDNCEKSSIYFARLRI